MQQSRIVNANSTGINYTNVLKSLGNFICNSNDGHERHMISAIYSREFKQAKTENETKRGDPLPGQLKLLKYILETSK